MSLLCALQRPPACRAWYPARRCYASASQASAAPAVQPGRACQTKGAEVVSKAKSSCAEGTILVGLNYLKGQPEVLAMADDAYPDWLWKLLEPKKLPDDGPGGKAEKYALRKANRQKIRDANFLKTR